MLCILFVMPLYELFTNCFIFVFVPVDCDSRAQFSSSSLNSAEAATRYLAAAVPSVMAATGQRISFIIRATGCLEYRPTPPTSSYLQ